MNSTDVWIPLESNPELLEELGVSVKKWKIHDVYGFDSDVLSLIPEPVLALFLLFPLTENTGKRSNSDTLDVDHLNNIYFMEQQVSMACGTIALIHGLFNNVNELNVDKDSFLYKLFNATKHLNPSERGKTFKENTEIAALHAKLAKEGQTLPPDLNEPDVIHHFITFIQKDGILYELDGRRNAPLMHGICNENSFLQKSIEVCKKIISAEPDNHYFTVMVLAASK